MLMHKDFPFVFGPDQIAAQDNLWSALLKLPALRPIDYGSAANVILTVNTSQIVVGFYLCQCALDNPRLKLELYGLFCALQLLKMYLIGVQNLIVEVDAHYIKGMLTNPDLEPSTSINRWIVSILTFHFTLVHVPNNFDDWIDNLYGFLHQINNTFPTSISTLTTAIFTSSLIGDPPTNTDTEDEGPTIDYSDIP
ncbi:hypothetical protein HETIRDRAFT_452291 [Heterobasidion irregulare TC 32-1]|uniref:Reverse transcriptase RNase H-like domain-containing protein n=1 Tax=Heterobasidion irregulare (strain TC 32-1) TaxID=747525 RepID=W4K633_HETIT|nr:uncharacterized protein HETIRDRAFT_452291 [Heterobasidion irregulare TC 32-1]ETW80785.1 hypothetical protein HETIRDRAFT_452291 [Heterobasidion irregulare TC 32-1]